jgi:pimeloyl-ACP methyl ester carboxylesterase
MPTVAVDDTTLYYERAGHGPTVLFVHGQCGHADVWAGQAERLADRATCVRYDRRGHSRSARGDAPLGAARHADDAAGLIEALELAPCLVVGSSFGGVITVDLARRYPALLRGIVVSEPPLFSLLPDGGRAAMADLRPHVDEAVVAGGPRAGVDAFMSLVCAEMWAMLDEDARDRLRDNADIAFADLAAPTLAVAPPDLAALTLPALVVAGTTGFAGPRQAAHRLAEALPDARFVEIAGGHVPYLEHPDHFARAVSAFVAELDRSGTARSA